MTNRNVSHKRLSRLLEHGLGERWTLGILAIVAPDHLPSKAVLDDVTYARADRLARHAVEAIEEAIESAWLAASDLADLPLAERWSVPVNIEHGEAA